MSATLISFEEQPKFGFAHHFYTDDPCQLQTQIWRSFVLVYVKSGHLTAEIYDQSYEAPADSLLILFRHIPFRLFSTDGSAQDYCSLQVITDYTFALQEDGVDFPADFAGLALPVVTPPCPETELIKKELFSIVSNLGISREKYGFAASLSVCGILARLDMFYRQKLHSGKTPQAIGNTESSVIWQNISAKTRHFIPWPVNWEKPQII